MADELDEPVEPYVFDPAHEAHRLRLGGAGWAEIAARLQYPSVGAARAAVGSYLKRAAAGVEDAQRAESLRLELERCDALQLAFWDNAVQLADDKAANVVLNVMRHRAKLLGLEAQDRADTGGRTIIIGGNPEEYVAGLRAVVDRQAAEDREHPDGLEGDPQEDRQAPQ